ncbi:STAS domain-containing protein [Stratiformator vulcanicus]|uniref:STAS domain-containing protein n=1 Tax=Stratiformator vulcanicus TaxID=2527980 RepID=A0A517R606_9PLAN|nr:STAS domain-containing protein [Stratiformator vulcanicus]QDT39327.1 hypothetical protein Pan189_37330 [Stratiformator vulcanicus]
MAAPTNHASVEVVRGVTVLRLGPQFESLDESHLDDVRELVMEVIDDAPEPRLVIDLTHTKFFGSAFLEVLFRAWNRVSKEQEGRFVLSGVTEYCREILEVTHLSSLWTVYPTAEAAVADIAEE